METFLAKLMFADDACDVVENELNLLSRWHFHDDVRSAEVGATDVLADHLTFQDDTLLPVEENRNG